MPPISLITKKVYFAPTRRRHFFTARAAAKAEATAVLNRKYPSESPEYGDSGEMISSGYHWSADLRLVRVRDRLAGWILNRLKGEGS